MTKFNKFGRGSTGDSGVPTKALPPPSNGSSARQLPSKDGIALPTNEQLAKYQRALEQEAAAPHARFALLLDATGSMQQLLEGARRHMKYIVERAVEHARGRVQIVAYRDYDCGPQVVEASGVTVDTDELVQFLDGLQPKGGGPVLGEAIERALATVLTSKERWTAIFVAGDEPAHSKESQKAAGGNERLALEWAKEAGNRGIPIFCFVVPGTAAEPETRKSFTAIAQASGGQCGTLDGESAMRHMIGLAIAFASKGKGGGSSAVRDYLNKHPALTPATREFGQKLLGPAKGK